MMRTRTLLEDLIHAVNIKASSVDQLLSLLLLKSQQHNESVIDWVLMYFIKHKYQPGLQWIIDNDLPYTCSWRHSYQNRVDLYYLASTNVCWEPGVKWLLENTRMNTNDLQHTLNFISKHNALHLLPLVHTNVKSPTKAIKYAYSTCMQHGNCTLYDYAEHHKFRLEERIFCLFDTRRLLIHEIQQSARFLEDTTAQEQLLNHIERKQDLYIKALTAILSRKHGMYRDLIMYILSWL